MPLSLLAMNLIDRSLERLRILLEQPAAVALVIALIIFPLTIEGAVADPDLFARVAVGWLVDTLGFVPVRDPFSFAPKKEWWIDHEWLSGVIFFYLTRYGGEVALLAFSGATFFFSVWFLASAQQTLAPRASGRMWILLFACADARYLWASVVRAQVFTYLFLAAWLWVIARVIAQREYRALLVVPPLMAVWCNLHGGFVVGIGLHAVFVFSLCAVSYFSQDRYPRREVAMLFLSLVGAIAATACNPYGFGRYWGYILEAVTMPRPSIGEWAAPALGSFSTFGVHLCGLVLLVSLSRLTLERVPILMVCLAAVINGYRHVRLAGAALFTVAVFAPVLFMQGQVDSLRKHRLRDLVARAGALALCVLAVIGGVSLAVRFVQGRAPLSYEGYPVGALEWLEGIEGGGRLLVDFNNGSIALWRLFPRFQVALDGRYEELYPESTVALVSTALSPLAPGHQEALQALDPDFILVGSGAAHAFRPDWMECFADPEWRVLIPTDGRACPTPTGVRPRPTMWSEPYGSLRGIP